MIRYYKLFDLLNRKNMNKSDLLEILSSKTIAKLSKGDNITTEVINKICLFLECQPGDIMECIIDETKPNKNGSKTVRIIHNDDLTNEPIEIIDIRHNP